MVVVVMVVIVMVVVMMWVSTRNDLMVLTTGTSRPFRTRRITAETTGAIDARNSRAIVRELLGIVGLLPRVVMIFRCHGVRETGYRLGMVVMVMGGRIPPGLVWDIFVHPGSVGR